MCASVPDPAAPLPDTDLSLARSTGPTRALQPPAFELIAARFRVLADPLRLQLLFRLKSGPLSVGELVEHLQVSQPTVSKHLKVLHEAGILGRRQEGTTVFYSIGEHEIFALCELVCSSLEQRLRARMEHQLQLLGPPSEEVE